MTLDVTRMKVDERGVSGFVWPLAREEVVAVRDAIIPLLVSQARQPASGEDSGTELVGIAFTQIVNHALTIYQALALQRRFFELGIQPEFPPGSQLTRALADGTAPSPPLLKALAEGLPLVRARGRGAITEAQRLRRWNGLSPKILRGFNPKNDVVATQASPLIDRHARSETDFVRFRGMGEWLRPLDDQSVADAARDWSNSPEVVHAVAAINAGFAAGNEALPDYLEQYLKDWLARVRALVNLHLQRLRNNPDRLPARLWTGTGANIWTRILSHACRSQGGTVTGHDHGNGTGHLVSTFATLSEFESCDTFVTFTADQAQALRKGLRRDLLIQASPPKIVAVPGRAPRNPSRRQPLGATKTLPAFEGAPAIQRIMCPTIYYPGERVIPAFPMLPDLVSVDWQARLLGHLREWGYHPVLKPHPGSPCPPPPAFVDQLGAEMRTEPFEEVMDAADAFLFDSPCTTTFGVALASRKPVILVDYGRARFTPEARAMLERRCGIVTARFDEANRVQIDWEELRATIEESPRLLDPAFVEHFLGPVHED